MNATQLKPVKLQVEALENRCVPATMFLNSGVLRVTGTEYDDTIRIGYSGHHIAVEGVGQIDAWKVKSVAVDARGGHDFIDVRALQVSTVVYAGDGNDLVFGTARNDSLHGGRGNDRIYGFNGNDQLYGDLNEDQLFGLDGNDALYGGYDNDRLFGGNGTDYLYGYFGNDFMDDGNRSAQEYADGGPDFDWNADIVSIGGTTAKDVQQRGAPTCSFLATLAALTDKGYDFRHWITYAGAATDTGIPQYDVAFWSGSAWKWTRVEFTGALTWNDPGHLTIPDRPAVEYESWVILMQRAWIKSHGSNGSTSPAVAMYALSGHAPLVQRRIDDAAFAQIAAARSKKLPVVAGTMTNATSPRLVGNHAYTVLQVSGTGSGRRVLIRNPWGEDGGTVTSNDPKDGLVWIWWADFKANVDYLAIW